MISITCQRAAELVSQSLETRLSGWERLTLGLHLGICGPCWRFRRQSFLVQRAGRLAGQPERAGRAAASLSEAARERIKSRLRSENPEQLR
jgi:hypothetical protein